jgi:hypothetical protein
MSAAIVPFPDRARRQVDEALVDQREVLRRTRRCISETWELRAESRRIKRNYEARQYSIERLLAGLPERV